MNNMKIKNIIGCVALLATFTACDDMFSPAIENNRGIQEMYNEPAYAQGLLGYAYAMLPYDTRSVSDVATDDAVTNDRSNNLQKMAQGAWNSANNPVSQWQARKATIQYLNIFLENVDKVVWAKDEKVNAMYCDHLKGEAYALRALNMYYLLMAHAGKTSDGRMLGVPKLTSSEGASSDFNLSRNTFQECLDMIFEDIDAALQLLPLDYVNVKDADIPAKYKANGVTNAGDYNRVFGTYMRGRMSARIAEAIRAQVALLATSPAFIEGTTINQATAADYAAIVLDRIGGVSGIAPKGHTWFMNTAEIDNLGSGAVPAEIIWRGNISNGDADWDIGLQTEKDNFPPSLYGNGRINPTQNLVDAFPMANGYPIDDALSGYSKKAPYVGRDPRLAQYIIYDGANFKGKTITTGTYTSDNDGLNKQATSTRTGYYMRKLLREDCSANPSALNAQKHYTARIRYTEIFLAYAESANEAWGPTGKGNHAYSAYDVIKAIRARAGVGADNGDAYLESIKNDKDKMRQLIRNERRIELCFENKRFWDLRRWKAPLTEPAQGMQVSKAGDELTYTEIKVEDRVYKDYMYYGPIPYDETMKWGNLEQNAGW